jgi:hypothetical protein
MRPRARHGAGTRRPGAASVGPARCPDGPGGSLGQGGTGEVGQLYRLEAGPQALDRIELGCISRQPLHDQPGPLHVQPSPHGGAAVGGQLGGSNLAGDSRIDTRRCGRCLSQRPLLTPHNFALTVGIDLRKCWLAWRLAADYSHGGSQGFKSPHLHPTTALVTGLAGHLHRAGAVPGSLAGQQTGSNSRTKRPTATRLRQETERSDTYPAFRLRDGCSASNWTAPDGSSLLTLSASSVQTAPDGSKGSTK